MSVYGYIKHSELFHHGIKGQKWGVRRYQNEDGSLTEAGKRRYSKQIYRNELRRDFSRKINDAYTNYQMGASLLGAIPTAGLSLIPGVIASQMQIKNDRKIDDRYDKKLQSIRDNVKNSVKLENDLYKSNPKFKKIRDSYNSRKELEKEREKAWSDWNKKVEENNKLLDKTYNICNSNSSSSTKINAFKNYMENAISDDDHGGLGKPGSSPIYTDKHELKENVDWLANEFGLTLTEKERQKVVDSYSKYYKKN